MNTVKELKGHIQVWTEYLSWAHNPYAAKSIQRYIDKLHEQLSHFTEVVVTVDQKSINIKTTPINGARTTMPEEGLRLFLMNFIATDWQHTPGVCVYHYNPMYPEESKVPVSVKVKLAPLS